MFFIFFNKRQIKKIENAGLQSYLCNLNLTIPTFWDSRLVSYHFAGKTPLLGVCIGQQAIMEAIGGSLINLDQVCYGVATPIQITVEDEVLYKGRITT